MISTRPTLLALAALTCPLALHAAQPDLATEYDQVLKIAQRDPKVRAAYEAADRKLAEKIIEIDPALKGYRPGQPAPKKSAAAAPAARPVSKAEPKKPAAPATTATPAKKGNELSHVVAKGETLGGIAARYGVTTASLKAANNIQDERKLMPGHVLVIPGGKKPVTVASAKPAPKTKHSSTPAAPAKEQGFWDKLKSNF
jgi:LysM repeat protein